MKDNPERYLEAIYELEKAEGDQIKSIDVSDLLNVSRAYVSRALKALKSFGYVKHQTYGKITLTEKGRETAKKLVYIKNLLIKFFEQVAGLSHDEAVKNAIGFRYNVSAAAVTRFAELVK